MDFLDDLFGSDEETAGQTEEVCKAEDVSVSSSTSESTPSFLSFYTSSSSFSQTSLVEIRENPQAGGARGVYARRKIEAGSLLVLEWPAVQWKDLDFSSPKVVKEILLAIFSDSKAYACTQSLYPYDLAQARAELKEEISEAYGFLQGKDNILKQVLSQLSQTQSISLSNEEIVRVFLTLRHNGFSSGLYLSLCMINHSCLPNSIKFEPRAGSRGASEVSFSTFFTT